MIYARNPAAGHARSRPRWLPHARSGDSLRPWPRRRSLRARAPGPSTRAASPDRGGRSEHRLRLRQGSGRGAAGHMIAEVYGCAIWAIWGCARSAPQAQPAEQTSPLSVASVIHPIREAGAGLASGETAEGTVSRLRPHSITRRSQFSAGPDPKLAHEAGRVSADQELKHHSSPYPPRCNPGASADGASNGHSRSR